MRPSVTNLYDEIRKSVMEDIIVVRVKIRVSSFSYFV